MNIENMSLEPAAYKPHAAFEIYPSNLQILFCPFDVD